MPAQILHVLTEMRVANTKTPGIGRRVTDAMIREDSHAGAINATHSLQPSLQLIVVPEHVI